MNSTQTTYGEVHCLLCGRCLADIATGPDGRLRLRRTRSAGEPKDMVRLVRGKLHCARCGGRAFVEWDLLPTSNGTLMQQAA
jgi:hypothetical protein